MFHVEHINKYHIKLKWKHYCKNRHTKPLIIAEFKISLGLQNKPKQKYNYLVKTKINKQATITSTMNR